jgi:hypothetical protein
MLPYCHNNGALAAYLPPPRAQQWPQFVSRLMQLLLRFVANCCCYWPLAQQCIPQGVCAAGTVLLTMWSHSRVAASLQTHKAQHGTAWRGTAWFCIVEHLTHYNVCTLDTMTFSTWERVDTKDDDAILLQRLAEVAPRENMCFGLLPAP